MQLPEGLKSRYSAKERPWSSLYYSKGKTIELPNFQEDFEVHLATDVALGLQPRQLNETTAVARLRTKLFASSGQYQLVAAQKQSDQSKRHLLHRDTVRSRSLVTSTIQLAPGPRAALLGRLGRRLAPASTGRRPTRPPPCRRLSPRPEVRWVARKAAAGTSVTSECSDPQKAWEVRMPPWSFARLAGGASRVGLRQMVALAAPVSWDN